MVPCRQCWLAVGALVLSLAATASPAIGQTASVQQDLTLDSIFSSDVYSVDTFGPARWLDGDSYTTVEPSARLPGAEDIVRYDAASGDRQVLVGAERLVPEFNREQALSIDDYDWSPDGRLLSIFTNSQRVWRRNTRGDYWVLDLDSGDLRKVGSTMRNARQMFAKFSPDSSRIAYVTDNNLFMHDLRNDVVTQLTHDGSDTIINGTFDWVYEEELGLRDGFRWSPDGTHIAFWQLDQSLVRKFTLANNTAQLYPVLTEIPYPKAGEVNAAARLAIIPAGGGDAVWVALPGSPRNNYIARMEWATNSTQLVVQYLNRRQNENTVYLADTRTGKALEVLVETDEAWVDVRDDLRWLDGGNAFTWVSERDGWRRVYRISRDGRSVVALTPTGSDILGVVRVDEAGGWLYYLATPDPSQRFLYRTPLAPVGPQPTAEALTPVDTGGDHTYDVAPGGRWAFHTWSSFSTPPQVELVSLPEHASVRVLVDNAVARQRIEALDLPPVEFFRVQTKPDLELDAWVLYPPDFDPARRYPVLFFVYGEPWDQTVLDRWGGSRMLWHRYVAQLGYLVVSVDNRGTPAPRGRDWRKIVYGEIGTLASQDQADAVRQIIATRDYVDPDRIGIWGWSGGGSMTLNAMFRHPEIYSTGMSVAPVPDQRYYDTIYQERYMGTPQGNPEGYRKGSPITHAHGLVGNLLIVHGTGDDNVHYQGTEALINRLVSAGKHFTMMAYPNRTHGISEGGGTTRHLYGLLTRYLTENLPAGAR